MEQQIMITNINKQELVDIVERSVLKVFNSSLPTHVEKTAEKPIGVARAAQILMLSTPSIYRKSSKLEIPHFKKGNRLYFYESKLLEWIENGKVLTKSEIDQMAEFYVK